MRNSPLDLFEIDPEKTQASAELLRERLLQVSKPKTPEVTLRVAFQSATDDVAKSLGINLSWRDEYHMIEGRADTVYGGLVIEYEPPFSLRPSNKTAANAHAIGQVRDYITGLQRKERHKIDRYAGVVCDGCFFVFLRSKESHWHVEPPAPVTVHTCERFLRYLFALQTEFATTPENLLRDFGEDSLCARNAVTAFYDALTTSEVPKIGTIYRQ